MPYRLNELLLCNVAHSTIAFTTKCLYMLHLESNQDSKSKLKIS